MEILAAFGEDKDLEKVLKSVLDGISDIIGVYKPDHSLVLYNSAGYEFFKKKPEEVIGKKCYEILGRNIPCSLCTTAQAINTKKIVRLEKSFQKWAVVWSVHRIQFFVRMGNWSM